MGGCLALLSAIAGVGLYQIVHRVQTLVSRQVKLDQTSGRAMLNIRAATRSMEASLTRVLAYREAARTACLTVVLCPEANQVLTVALVAEYGIEMGIKTYWSAQSSSWALERGIRSAYPEFPFPVVDPSQGANGLEAERYFMSTPPKFLLRIQDQNLVSQAIAYRTSTRNWQVKWNE